ncbi:hypothetical protein HNV12_01135 [Methanococcoides sp. SA1]|nr:hypothetical protein [Methanococcoides sp. SA1]
MSGYFRRNEKVDPEWEMFGKFLQFGFSPSLAAGLTALLYTPEYSCEPVVKRESGVGKSLAEKVGFSEKRIERVVRLGDAVKGKFNYIVDVKGERSYFIRTNKRETKVLVYRELAKSL